MNIYAFQYCTYTEYVAAKDGIKQTATKIEVQHYEYVSKYVPKDEMPY